MSLYNQALADVRSTGAGIKCLYCSCDKRLSTVNGLDHPATIVLKSNNACLFGNQFTDINAADGVRQCGVNCLVE